MVSEGLGTRPHWPALSSQIQFQPNDPTGFNEYINFYIDWLSEGSIILRVNGYGTLPGEWFPAALEIGASSVPIPAPTDPAWIGGALTLPVPVGSFYATIRIGGEYPTSDIKNIYTTALLGRPYIVIQFGTP